VAVLAVAVLAAACSSGGDGQAKLPPTTVYRAPPSAAGGGRYTPMFAEGSCPPTVPVDPAINCGSLTVPERHERPEGRQVRLAVARLTARTPNPAPDPLLILVGGPGDSGLAAVEGFLTSSARDAREVIFLDQRGTGASTPSLACPELDALLVPQLAARPNDRPAREAQLDATRACRTRLVDDGVDLGAYTSAESAADVADLRVALGIDSWNVQGTSYGTRLALTLARDHPEGVRALVLDSTVPLEVDGRAELRPNAQRAFDELFEGCAADPGCASAHGDLGRRTAALVARLDARPGAASTPDPATGAPVAVAFDGDVIAAGLFGGLYDTELIPLLPSFLAAADRGELPTVAAALVSETVMRLSGFSRGMNLSVQCAEEEPFAAGDGPPLLGLDVELDVIVPAQCEVWDVPRAPAIETEAVRSDIPALIVAGQYDPITPPAWGKLVAKALPASTFVEFPGQGHGQFVHECPRSIRTSFLAEPSRPPDTTCVASMGAPKWVVRAP
jgi:pimeloyl-ACP methyl ester carboxylesterase